MNQNLFSVQSQTILATTSGTINTASTPILLPVGGPTIKITGSPKNTDVVTLIVSLAPTNATNIASTPSAQQIVGPGEVSTYTMPTTQSGPLYFSTISATASQNIYISVGDGV